MLTIVGAINIQAVKSPMRLLFGAAESPARPSTSKSIIRDAEVDRLGSTDSVFEVINLPTPMNIQGCVFWRFSSQYTGVLLRWQKGNKHFSIRINKQIILLPKLCYKFSQDTVGFVCVKCLATAEQGDRNRSY